GFCCRLCDASDLCGRNSCPPPSIWRRTHALASCVAARRTRGKLSRTTHGESATCRFDVSGPRFQLVHAIELPVDAFQRSGEHLLAPQRMFGRARTTPASRRLFPSYVAALLAVQSSFLVANIAQPLPQRLEVIKTGIIDSGVMTAQDDLMLLVAENAAFEFAGYGHSATHNFQTSGGRKTKTTLNQTNLKGAVTLAILFQSPSQVGSNTIRKRQIETIGPRSYSLNGHP